MFHSVMLVLCTFVDHYIARTDSSIFLSLTFDCLKVMNMDLCLGLEAWKGGNLFHIGNNIENYF